MDSIASLRYFSIHFNVDFINYGPIQRKTDDKAGYALGHVT